MISITVPKGEVFDNEHQIFWRVTKETTIQLEHSLISLQKWEAKWHVPFLVKGEKTLEQTIDYIRCMCLTSNVKEDVFYCIPKTEMERIAAYIEDPMTATTVRQKASPPGLKKNKIVTAEVIYYWMISLNIPSEYKKWHLNQLLMLIQVINAENAANTPKKKRSKHEIMADYRAINEANKKRFNTKG